MIMPAPQDLSMLTFQYHKNCLCLCSSPGLKPSTYSMPLEYHDAGQWESFKLGAINVTL